MLSIGSKIFREQYQMNPPQIFTFREALELRQRLPLPGDLEYRKEAVEIIHQIHINNNFKVDVYYLAIKLLDIVLSTTNPFQQLPQIVFILAAKHKSEKFRTRDDIVKVPRDKQHTWNILELHVLELLEYNVNYSTPYDYYPLLADYNLNYLNVFVRSELVFKFTDYELIEMTTQQLTPEHQELYYSLIEIDKL